MDNDDGMVGRLLSRREVLALLGAAGAGTIAARAAGQSSAVRITAANPGVALQDMPVSDEILARAPYIGEGRGRVRNERDGIFRNEGGKNLILAVARQGNGYAGTFDIGMNMG